MERRRYERVPFLCRVTLAARPGGPARDGQTTDISLGGVGLMTAGHFQPGQGVTITFHLRNARQQPVTEVILGTVVNLKADLDANRLGVEFLEPLDEKKHPLLSRKVLAL